MADTPPLPEKARRLITLKAGGFQVPPFLYVSAEKFIQRDFSELEQFLSGCQDSYKVIARSAHPLENRYRGGTFYSVSTYADVGGIVYARKRIIKQAEGAKWLSILRQQVFNQAPPLNLEEMGVIVMPFIQGIPVMAKKMGRQWEFGYSGDSAIKVHNEPYITQTPHDRKLLELSENIQTYLGFPVEIEYVASPDNAIHVVQATDIGWFELLEHKSPHPSVRLDGVRRIRRRHNYRERPVFVMDNKQFYIDLITACEHLVLDAERPPETIDPLMAMIADYERRMEAFALRHERFAVLGLFIKTPEELYQVANKYLDDTPSLQQQLSKALYNNLYKIDKFLSEADTLIAKDRIRMTLGTHEAYGIGTVRNPIWVTFWKMETHDRRVREFQKLGFKTGDTVGIEIDAEEIPTVYRL